MALGTGGWDSPMSFRARQAVPVGGAQLPSCAGHGAGRRDSGPSTVPNLHPERGHGPLPPPTRAKTCSPHPLEALPRQGRVSAAGLGEGGAAVMLGMAGGAVMIHRPWVYNDWQLARSIYLLCSGCELDLMRSDPQL